MIQKNCKIIDKNYGYYNRKKKWKEEIERRPLEEDMAEVVAMHRGI